MNTPFILIAGGSYSGKTTLVTALVSKWPEVYKRPVSFTSRARRANEDGSEYNFVTKNEILDMEERDELANLDTVHGEFYAMNKSSISDIVNAGKYPIKEIHPKNFKKISSVHPNTITVLVQPNISSEIPSSQKEARRTMSPDDEYFTGVNAEDFDFVIDPFSFDCAESAASFLNTAIQAITVTDGRYPRPSDINKFNKAGYDLVSAEFSDEKRITTHGFHTLSEPFFESVLKGIPAGSACLEVGPGQGWLRKTFKWPPVQYMTCDLSKEMIKSITEPDESSACIASAHNLPYKTRSLDFVFCSLADPYCYPAALLEINRVLKLTGKLVLTAPNKRWSDAIRKADEMDMTSFVLSDGKSASVHSFTYCGNEISKLFKICGLLPLVTQEVCGTIYSGKVLPPPAFEAASLALGIPLSKLPILNCIVAGINHET